MNYNGIVSHTRIISVGSFSFLYHSYLSIAFQKYLFIQLILSWKFFCFVRLIQAKVLSDYTSKSSNPPEIICEIRHVEIIPDYDKKYYVWRQDQKSLNNWFRNCVGVFVYLPSEIIDVALSNLPFFEHFHSEGVSFTWYFQRLKYTITAVKDIPMAYLFEERHYKVADLIEAYTSAPWLRTHTSDALTNR